MGERKTKKTKIPLTALKKGETATVSFIGVEQDETAATRTVKLK